MSDKKDILEFPLEELEVPQAIALMMQAGTTCVHHGMRHEDPLLTDDHRLIQLCEKLEARIEDAIENARFEKKITDVEEEEIYRDAEPSETHLVLADGDVYQVVHKGVVFGKLCNEIVNSEVLGETEETTRCIKQWGHKMPEHEDMDGRFRK